MKYRAGTGEEGYSPLSIQYCRRAQAVLAYFTAAGIDTARISATGFGQDKPIASNDTSEGRAKNRRIEFQVK